MTEVGYGLLEADLVHKSGELVYEETYMQLRRLKLQGVLAIC